MKTIQEGKSLVVYTNLISPYPMSQLYFVFSNRVLYYENGHPIKSSLQSQQNHHQNSNIILQKFFLILKIVWRLK